MKNFFQKRLKNEKGLTLVELLAVLVILAVIAAIATPAIGNIITNSKYNAVKADAINVMNAGNLYFAEDPTDEDGEINSVKVNELIENGFLENRGKIPEEATISKANPNTLTTTAISYSSGKTVTFTAATLQQINEDVQKPKDGPALTIPKKNN